MAPSSFDSYEPTSTSPPSRLYLRLQAIMWRSLMAIGMFIHRLAPPRPASPSFTRQIPTTISPTSGAVTLHFYVPKSYHADRRNAQAGTRYPVVVNFHGGGFTLGAATDDARWATTVMRETGAVVASVDYRLAPEYPFPTAVEDGVDAVLYVAKHAKELHLDAERIALSGFSAGGNMSFTVPMRLFEELDPGFDQAVKDINETSGMDGVAANAAESASPNQTSGTSTDVNPQRSSNTPHPTKTSTRTTMQETASSSSTSSTITFPKPKQKATPPIRPVALVSFYPSTDYTRSRATRRSTCPNPAAEISPVLTSLFDSSYLSPADTLDFASPFLSPVLAPNQLLVRGLPDTIVLYTCEWDMLAHEGRDMGEKLRKLGKTVVWEEVPGVPHAWDKKPNPWREAEGVKEAYSKACEELRRAFGLERQEGGGGALLRRLSLRKGAREGKTVEQVL